MIFLLTFRLRRRCASCVIKPYRRQRRQRNSLSSVNHDIVLGGGYIVQAPISIRMTSGRIIVTTAAEVAGIPRVTRIYDVRGIAVPLSAPKRSQADAFSSLTIGLDYRGELRAWDPTNNRPIGAWGNRNNIFVKQASTGYVIVCATPEFHRRFALLLGHLRRDPNLASRVRWMPHALYHWPRWRP